MNTLHLLPSALLPWYRENKRDLPWRQDKDPYHIWLSEIMLQQTRVEAVKGYYLRFLQALPDIASLAACEDDTLHQLWEGLGYYSRVRNLKKAAQVILSHHGGVFPRDHAAVLALTGIGSYTAGAICSIAFDQPIPAVDGNVLRVVTRLTQDPTPIDLPAFKKDMQSRLAQIYPAEAGDFTQALMELGATLCGPNRAPQCESCPCKGFCGAYQNGTTARYPVKLPKREKRAEEKTVFILSCNGRYALQKRPQTGLLAGLWEFPNVPGTLTLEEALRWVDTQGLSLRNVQKQVHKQHIFTHIRWQMQGFYLEVADPAGSFTWLQADEIRENAALPTAFRQFWEETDDV